MIAKGRKRGIHRKIDKVCEYCKKTFSVFPYRIKGKFCSKECYWKSGKTEETKSKISIFQHNRYLNNPILYRQDEETKRKIGLANKGKSPWCKGKKIPQNSGEKNHMWRGGRTKRPDGYIVIYKPDHPSVIERKSFQKHPRLGVFEHRLVMEKMIGRYLTKDEIVHHKNGIRDDNRPNNLILSVRNKNWHPCLCPKCGFEFRVE